MSQRRLPVVLALSLALLSPTVATAHPDHPDPAWSSVEMFPGEGVAVAGDLQHSGTAGHLPPVQENVTLVGKAEVTNPSGDGNDGRVADVFAHGDYAYLTAFREPTCEQAGVHVMDISDPAAPVELTGAFIPTTVGSYAGEGIQVIPMDNEFFTGDLLIHQNETCPAGPPPPGVMQKGGINLWDVSDPTDPEPVKLHVGDLAGGTDAGPNQTHSMRAWTNVFDKRTYVALVDDEELTDVDILDITDPFNPALVNDHLNLDEPPFDVDQASPANLTATFSHDMMIEKIGQRYVMNVNYWDGGYVLLDVTDPRPGQVALIAESDYPALDEERLARGHSISPEGNAHQSELSPNNKYLLATDEDFNPYRVVATITSGIYNGTEYTATSASATPPIQTGTSIVGTPTFVGLACAPLPAGTGIALVERGGCTFQVKLDNIAAAGYSSGIVFNSGAPNTSCMAGVTMLAAGSIPYVFVNRLVGLQLLGVAGVTTANACTTATPAPGSPVSSTSIQAIFDGWGYVRLFGTEIPNQRGRSGSITSLDTYAVPESQDEDFATGFGTLSVHEVAMASETGLAYISYYAAGLRVVTYGKNGIQEVGAFIDEGGNDFWGVEVWHDEHGTEYVLASDRDFGLYIFRYTP